MRIIRNVVLAVTGAAVTLGLATGLAHAASSHGHRENTARMYGDPAAAAPYWRMQSYDDCALMASADVIAQLTHRELTEQEVIALAQRLPSQSRRGSMYTSGYGTDPTDLPLLLSRYGVDAGYVDNVGMEALERYLASGNKVIVGINAELIWGIPVVNRDQAGNPAADHAVVVTGVDTAAGKVHLNDSGNAQGRDETVPIDVFVRSWATGGDQMVVAWTAS
ncbi:hypothetical protein BST27_27765 [Mycobacterium intermedium]|uniref:Peptidase C39-like domain-containing protein n=1 Tax=Mycobacterium intermedium TaxID=28445 RepID=A0A1E3SCG5_MYCIE|nr:C39 family peptidase [Mycobacterium intermedium]MCV6962488.1 C39 family peptidase [Mycobacterium intermedium]ODQ99761.1 hypothetical protein BHQ20_15800 [Mycobacterium intermedium]OPE46755.1 hypothetical protein BV508_24785 [Mycobacterium intermedium]ORA94588.1 hypothetical protein BST27_27765 [Mycobacterium intermedium]